MDKVERYRKIKWQNTVAIWKRTFEENVICLTRFVQIMTTNGIKFTEATNTMKDLIDESVLEMDNNVEGADALEQNGLLKNYIKQTISAGMKQYKEFNQERLVIEMKKAIDETNEPIKISFFKRLKLAFKTLMIALFAKRGS